VPNSVEALTVHRCDVIPGRRQANPESIFPGLCS